MSTQRLFLLATELEAKPILKDSEKLWTRDPAEKSIYHSNEGTSLLITGIGPTRTALSIARWSERFKTHQWINLGVVGALKKNMKVGEIIQVSTVFADYEAHPFDRSKDSIKFHDGNWKCITLGHPLHNEEKKQNLSQKGDIVDMELYPLAMASKMIGSELKSRKIVSDFSSESDKDLIVKRIPELMTKLWESQRLSPL